MSANPDLKSIQPNIIDVLVCDDHQIFKDGIRSILSDVDWIQIWDEASNGVECLEQIKSQVPDVVLLDINMPVMDGIQAVHEISKSSNIGEVQTIMLTTETSGKKKAELLKYKFVRCWIIKPITEDLIVATVDKVLER